MIGGRIVRLREPGGRARSPRVLLPIVAGLAGAIFVAACASIPLPEREGVVLYRKKCGACHRPYAPQEIRAAGWEKTFAEMRNRAKLTTDEIATIRRYLEPDLAQPPGSSSAPP